MDEARRHLRQSLVLEEGHHWTLSELAEVERAQGDIDAARGHYLAALKQAPDDHWCRGHLAQLEAEDGNRERAEELYREILTAEPETVWALVELAQLLAERDGAESRALAERALVADRTYPWAHAHLGQLARRAGDLPTAVIHYQDALDGAPDAPWLLHELAPFGRGRHVDL
jgi:predicted Zn-dependent protease